MNRNFLSVILGGWHHRQQQQGGRGRNDGTDVQVSPLMQHEDIIIVLDAAWPRRRRRAVSENAAPRA